MGEDADRQVTVEKRNRGMNHGIVRRIHDAARKKGGGRPITARAAEAPFDQVGAGCAPEVPHGESDGPPGAAAIARALCRGLKAVPVHVTEACHQPPVIASSRAAGVS
jgi:hypothetical protein